MPRFNLGLTLLCVGLALSPGLPTTPTSSVTQQQTMSEQLRTLLRNCLKASRSYLSAEGLPDAPKVRSLVAQLQGRFWEQLQPIENFFVFEIVPATLSKVPSAVVADAYCAGVAQLTADWWGMPGGTPSETGDRLLNLPDVRPCLVRLLDNTTPLSYLDGEANSLAKTHQWQVSDLAASFLLTLSQADYDADADISTRNHIKNQLRQGS